MTETINGLHSCKPGNEPSEGEVKTFVVQQMLGKKGKPYIKIKSEKAEYGGQPYRILQAEKTDFVDPHGNLSFNLEIEPAVTNGKKESTWESEDAAQAAQNAPERPPARSNDDSGVNDARKHLMQSVNLYTLCIDAANKVLMPHIAAIGDPKLVTVEMFQAAVGTLYIEASRDVWWSGKIVRESFLSKMPTHPIKNGGK